MQHSLRSQEVLAELFGFRVQEFPGVPPGNGDTWLSERFVKLWEISPSKKEKCVQIRACFKRNRLHREFQPALITWQGPTPAWWQNTDWFPYLHQIEFAKENTVPKIYYYREGKLHREEGPAYIYGAAQQFWIRGKLHRENGPAKIRANGTLEYYFQGKKHRSEGPAVIRKRGSNEWWLDGKKVWTED